MMELVIVALVQVTVGLVLAGWQRRAGRWRKIEWEV
jgi:hypothetical protein